MIYDGIGAADVIKSVILNADDERLISLALEEDLSFPYLDITTDSLFYQMPLNPQTAKIISKHSTPFVLCGLNLIPQIFKKLGDETVSINHHFEDGAIIENQMTICELHGSAITLLKAERTTLNFLQRLSAIATLTNTYVTKLAQTKTKILDTRKTSPGMRHLEKYAVQCGGGVNHRLGLYDEIMIKDTHVDLLGGMVNALQKLKAYKPKNIPVTVEVRNLDELAIVIENGKNLVNRVLLDNMSVQMLEIAVQKAKNFFETEASGNMSLETILSYANTGVDYISVGKITNSAGVVDLSMKGVQ